MEKIYNKNPTVGMTLGFVGTGGFGFFSAMIGDS